ncbi:MAG TPA: ATP-dependent DNA helicase [Acidimicrobiales bacterium]|nr:ATP-dependent DNA helicase [Acidimicrobiales bacterium]
MPSPDRPPERGVHDRGDPNPYVQERGVQDRGTGGAIAKALARAAGGLPNHEDRPEQLAMAEAVGQAIERHRHLVVQAGTGTGKSLAYLVPALALGARVVVSTATKALQDQLAGRDLPQLSRSLGVRFTFAVLKGRSNYVCLQRVAELTSGDPGAEQMQLGEGGSRSQAGVGPLGREVLRLAAWASGPKKATADKKGSAGLLVSGDRAELAWEPSEAAWAQVSTGWRECPGAAQCPSGGECFAEAARRRAGEADVVVVNTHLYATSLSIKEAELLPPHDLVVFDEAHELEDIVSAAFGFDLSQARLVALARSARALVADASVAGDVEDGATLLGGVLRPHRDLALVRPIDDDVAGALGLVRERASRLLEELRKAGRASDGAPEPRRLRAQKAVSHLIDDVSEILELPDSHIAWVEGPEHAPVLRVAPIDVGGALTERLWKGEGAPTAVLASATIPPRLGERLGLSAGSYDEIDVGSPFSYKDQALLYCPVHLPDPRAANFEAAMHEELVALIEASQGRALALFTSWRAMQAAAEVVRGRTPWKIFTQSDLPKPKLVAEFTSDEHSCLFATMGFWQGVDVPGPSLSLVTIDRIPFPRPDDPLLRARRAALGSRAFELIDVPRAATLLAQGVGRLVRTREDRGVVAVLDRRLGKAPYRWHLVHALPPMRRTRSRAEVEVFLASLRPGTASR